MAVAIAEVATVVATRRATPEGIKLGKELEKLRLEKLAADRQWTQKYVADRLGMSEEGYRNYVKGTGRITRHTLPKWANAFDVSIPDLAGRLGIDLLTDADPDAPALRRELAALMPDADAAEIDDMTRRVAALPASERRQVIDGWRDYLTGRLTRLGRA